MQTELTTPTTEPRQLTADEITRCFAVPGAHNIIDALHPFTGRGVYSNETLEQVRLRHPEAIETTIEAHCEEKAARQDEPVIWLESTQDQYDEMLCCLSPAMYTQGGFLVGEPSDHHAKSGQPRFQAYRRDDGKFLASSRPMTRTEFREVLKVQAYDKAFSNG